MKALHRQIIEFTPDDRDTVVAALDEIIRTANGWVNIEPIVEAEVLDDLRRRTPPAALRLFSGRGSKIPFGTFVAGTAAKPGQVGLEHSAGPRTVPRLREAGIVAPAGWRLRQDHGKRGIVYDVADAAGAEILTWLLASATLLAEVKLGEWWSAAVHARRV